MVKTTRVTRQHDGTLPPPVQRFIAESAVVTKTSKTGAGARKPAKVPVKKLAKVQVKKPAKVPVKKPAKAPVKKAALGGSAPTSMSGVPAKRTSRAKATTKGPAKKAGGAKKRGLKGLS